MSFYFGPKCKSLHLVNMKHTKNNGTHVEKMYKNIIRNRREIERMSEGEKKQRICKRASELTWEKSGEGEVDSEYLSTMGMLHALVTRFCEHILVYPF